MLTSRLFIRTYRQHNSRKPGIRYMVATINNKWIPSWIEDCSGSRKGEHHSSPWESPNININNLHLRAVLSSTKPPCTGTLSPAGLYDNNNDQFDFGSKMQKWVPSQTALRLGEIRPPTYSGYMVKKTHIPKIGFKFGLDQFGINSGYICFFNNIMVDEFSSTSRKGAAPCAKHAMN